jgi:uncharacterized protein (DUF2236 family)
MVVSSVVGVVPSYGQVSDQYFTDASWARRVHREQAVGLGGPRALLMMAADPVAFEGFFMHTGALGDPYERLRRTGVVMDTITFGSRARADVMTKRVRAMHRASKGVLPHAAGPFPAGTPYAADDPALLRWILACLVDSMLLVFDRYVAPMSDDDRTAYIRDYATIGKLFGLPRKHWPADADAFDAYMAERLGSGELVVTPKARELGIEIVMHPPAPPAARPLVEVVNQITIGLLPESIRRQFGFSWDPVRGLAVRGGQEYVRRVLVPLLPEKLRIVPSARAA